MNFLKKNILGRRNRKHPISQVWEHCWHCTRTARRIGLSEVNKRDIRSEKKDSQGHVRPRDHEREFQFYYMCWGAIEWL